MRRVLLNKAKACPVDLLSTRPASGYGTRRLTRRYTGPCLNMRRSSDNATLDIWFAGDVLDVQALYAFTGAGNSAYVVTWYDHFGSANCAQSTAGSQPRLVNVGVVDKVGDRLAPKFSGSQSLSSSVLAVSVGSTSSLTMTGVFNITSASNARALPGYFASTYDYDNVGSAIFAYAPSATVIAGYRNNSQKSQLTTALGTTYAACSVYDGANHSLRLNGSAGTPVASTGTFGSTGTIRFGTDNGGTSTTGSICEAVLFASALSISEQSVAERNMIQFFGIK